MPKRKSTKREFPALKSMDAINAWVAQWRLRGCPTKNWMGDGYVQGVGASPSKYHLHKGEYEDQQARFIAYWCDPKSPAFPFYPLTTREAVAKGDPANLLSWITDEQSKAIVATDNYRRVLVTMPTLQTVANVQEVTV